VPLPVILHHAPHSNRCRVSVLFSFTVNSLPLSLELSTFVNPPSCLVVRIQHREKPHTHTHSIHTHIHTHTCIRVHTHICTKPLHTSTNTPTGEKAQHHQEADHTGVQEEALTGARAPRCQAPSYVHHFDVSFGQQMHARTRSRHERTHKHSATEGARHKGVHDISAQSHQQHDAEQGP
jgi:hypothetical protein